jgi:hypothetical protein
MGSIVDTPLWVDPSRDRVNRRIQERYSIVAGRPRSRGRGDGQQQVQGEQPAIEVSLDAERVAMG